ncbi:MAG: hypothetical protein KAZ87_01160 [Spirochaetes bacterium]|nr:hypothetical protein [Spirochaetota bacterium]
MKKIFIITVLAIIVHIFVSCGGASLRKSDLNSIYVYHSSFGWRNPEYKIDFKENMVYEFKADDYRTKRNEKAKNQGYQNSVKITEGKLDEFLKESRKIGFFKWNGFYNDEGILDGHQWGIEIVFSDGQKKKISGSNKYPAAWDEMYSEFEKLTGKNILLLKSNWMKD